MNSKNVSSDNAIDPTIWVDEYGDYLLNFTLLRLRDQSVAEDLVQETFLSAFQSREKYESRSSVRTWLTSILRFKIIDHFRKHGSEPAFIEDSGEIDKYFEREDMWNGHWNKSFAPKPWNTTPEKILENSEFRMVLITCIMNLPERTARTFTLHEVDGMTCDEIADILGLTTNNCWVILHRARLHLRNCIQLNWFHDQEAKAGDDRDRNASI